jgi:ubiquitin-conjugating enzyme E2 Z
MSSPQIKRILSDTRQLMKDKLHDGTNGIYVKCDESDITVMYILIIGPKNTPYKGGFYMFKAKFPPTYPNKPPEVKFCTLNNDVRFNPNLYKDGKVCLSLLGTWSGPGWTACNTMESVLLSIQSMVLNDMPLRNEPGYENAAEDVLIRYNLVIEYFNYQVAVLNMLDYPPEGFNIFLDEMKEYFSTNYETYVADIIKLEKSINDNINLFPLYNKVGFMDTIYNIKVYTDMDLVRTKMNSIYSTLMSEKNKDVVETEEIICNNGEHQNIFLSFRKNTKLAEIQKLATAVNISIIIDSTSKKKNKTKQMLLDEIKTTLF